MKAQCDAAAAPRVAVLAGDAVLAALFAEWLAQAGCNTVTGGTDALPGAARPDLMLVELPWPRARAVGLLSRLASAHPGVPVIALSPNFFPSVASRQGP
ncbi:MAG: hypothetical protein KF778_07020 [Rhodocyclaceae bacterium]|nr:hypothetical protein [Rhodocyclaceae bacterium]MBX3668140.1 hypothetical protein [Rhodocyclaceae bacterium]